MLENEHGWKLTANLPQNLSSNRQFDLFINDVNFLHHDFAPMTESTSIALRGVITMNESQLLGEGQEFEWKFLTAQSSTRISLIQDQEINSRQIQNIDCSTGVL